MDTLKEKANFNRVCQLLVGKGGDAFRTVLHAKHPPSALAKVLKKSKSKLQTKRCRVIKDNQWDLLFPKSGAAPDSQQFDITLLSILLTNICKLTEPATGWNVKPPVGDTSESADIVRIKMFRNQVYHVASAQLDDATFEKLWQEISQPLIRLGIPQKDIDEIKMAPLSPEEESYIEKLKEWKEREDYILSKLNNIETEVSNLRKTVENSFPSQGKPDEWEPTSCLPDRLPMFTGREDQILNVIAILNDKKRAVVSLHGGPGFGKTAIAIEVSHKLNEENNISVVFSQLTSENTVDEMILQLFLDAGVNHDEDKPPKSSLILWLRNIKSNVIFVLDNIDNLLENKSSFYEFLRLLRKNSNQHCQIVTTSRTSFKIPDLPTDEVDVDVMDEKECMELLKKQCPIEDDKFLRRLAELCGNIPLAMCIAGSRVDDFEDPDELFQELEKQPMKTLKCPESDQCVNLAIDMSFKKCPDEEQETLIRLSVFEGNFSKKAAKAVIEKDMLETTDILKKLVSLSLIKEPTKQRYSVHLLIKHFLKEKQKSGNEQTKTKAERARKEAMRADVLMVEYYLELGHQLTIKSYSKDGYKVNSDALKREVSNIQNVLKICCQQEDPTRSDISDCLASSEIYKTSSRLFSIFIRSIIPRPIVHEFLERCANLAKEREQHIIKINFDCLLAAEIRDKSMGKSAEHFVSKMENIKKEFETYYEDVKEDKSLCAHFHYQNGRYLSFVSKSCQGKERLNHAIQARKELEKSLELRETLTHTLVGKANTIFLLMHLGTECKFIFTNERYLKNTSEADAAFEQAQKYYRDAIELSKVNLGEQHLLTLWIYKNLGDLFLTNKKHDQAEEMYTLAINISQNLGLDATEKYVLLLKNLGVCLTESDRASEAIQILKRALEIAEKLVESNEPDECTLKVYASLADCLQQSNRADEAVEVLENARENAERLAENDKTTVYKTEIYILLAECLKQSQRANEAIEVLERARDMAEKLPESYEPNECTFKVYISLADCLKQNDRADEAIEVLEKARVNAEKLAVNDEPTAHKTKVYLLLAECLKQNQRVNEAIENLEKARDNAEKLAANEPTVYKIKVYKLLAECLKQSQRANEAVEVLEKACDYTERLAVNDEPTVHKTKVYLLLAECLKQSQRVNEAIEILEKARDNAEKLAVNDEPTVHKAKVYLLLAECLKQNQRVNEAIDVLEKARDNTEKLAENDEPTVHKIKVYLLLAECLKQNQRVNEAIEILEKARDNAEKLAETDEPTVHKIKVYLLLAESLKQNQRVNEAIEILEKARDNAEKLAVNDEPTVYKIKVYKLLAECLKQSRRVNEAVEVLEKACDNTEKLAVNGEPTVHKTKVYLLLAECLKQSRRVNEAIEVLEKARDNAEKLAVNDEPTVQKIKVYLLLAECLKQNQRVNVAIEVLEKARDNAEKLAVNDEPTVYKTKVYTSLAIAYHTLQNDSEAVGYAKKAWEFDQLQRTIKRYEYKKLQEISQITVNHENN